MNNFVVDNMGVKQGLALSAILLVVGAMIPLWGAAPDARAVMESVYQQDKSKDMTLRANLDIFGKDGNGQKKKFVLKRIGGLGDSKTLLTFTDPAEIKGVTLLSVIHKGEPDQQWLYTPAIQRVRSIAPRERSEPFAGSDFT